MGKRHYIYFAINSIYFTLFSFFRNLCNNEEKKLAIGICKKGIKVWNYADSKNAAALFVFDRRKIAAKRHKSVAPTSSVAVAPTSSSDIETVKV